MGVSITRICSTSLCSFLTNAPSPCSAMEKQQDSGKTRGIGVSNMTISKMQALMST